MAALSLATELAMGQPAEFAMRSCILAMRLGKLMGADNDTLSDIYYQAHLRYLGCNADTQAMAALLGDEIAFRRDFARIDMGAANEMAALVFRHIRNANSGQGLAGLIINLLKGMATAQAKSAAILSGHCEVAQRLAERLGLSQSVRDNLGQLYERWDGKGIPNGLKGEAISPAVRIVSMAQDAVTLAEAFGPEVAIAKMRKRSGRAYDPRLLRIFETHAEMLLKEAGEATGQDVLDLEPQQKAAMTELAVDEACLVLADFADLKSPFSIGHSRAVARLAEEAAKRLGLPKEDVIVIRRAGLLHDIGMVSIPAHTLLKPGTFNDSEWERVRLHAYHGERVLARAPGLLAFATITGQHHERSNGTGYHRGIRGPQLAMSGMVLAAAEAYQNRVEERPHRPALSPKDAASSLRQEVRSGGFAPDVVEAVLAAAGHGKTRQPQAIAGLTPREIEMLLSLARGYSMKEIAKIHGIAVKTVDSHLQNIYGKIGVKTKGGAILFALEHGVSAPG